MISYEYGNFKVTIGANEPPSDNNSFTITTCGYQANHNSYLIADRNS